MRGNNGFDRNGDHILPHLESIEALDRLNTLEQIRKSDINLYEGCDPVKVSESFKKDPERWDDSYVNHSSEALRKRARAGKGI